MTDVFHTTCFFYTLVGVSINTIRMVAEHPMEHSLLLPDLIMPLKISLNCFPALFGLITPMESLLWTFRDLYPCSLCTWSNFPVFSYQYPSFFLAGSMVIVGETVSEWSAYRSGWCGVVLHLSHASGTDLSIVKWITIILPLIAA